MNPLSQVLSWSFPLMRLSRVPVRVSWLLLLWMAVDALRFAQQHQVWMIVAALIVPPIAMLLHAWAHIAMARAMGGTVHATVISILVDNTDYDLPLRPWAHALTGLAGPTCNLLIAGGCWLAQWLAFIPSDFAALVSYVLYVNIAIGAFNLLACGPFDGQRWWRGVLWAFIRMGAAVNATSILGLISAALLIAWGAWMTDFVFILLGVVALVATIQERQQIAMGSDPIFGVDPSLVGKGPPSRFTLARRERAIAKEAQQEADEQAVLDRLLAKVSAEGLPSLTDGERKQLQRISQAQQRRSG